MNMTLTKTAEPTEIESLEAEARELLRKGDELLAAIGGFLQRDHYDMECAEAKSVIHRNFVIAGALFGAVLGGLLGSIIFFAGYSIGTCIGVICAAIVVGAVFGGGFANESAGLEALKLDYTPREPWWK